MQALRRERLFVYVAVVLIVVFRSALFVFRQQLDFDADQAVIGLAGKHLLEGRAFPLFFYGQNYMLAVESWMAAPMFWLFGVSVASLKLPLLAINLAVGLLLVTLFERELGLRPLMALIASLFFLLPPPGAAPLLLETTGGNIEPFLYALLFWMTRRRPVWFGLVFGVGFLQREFTIYGVIAVFVVEIVSGAWRRREEWRLLLRAGRVAVEVWLVVQCLRPLASAAGPGTSLADLYNKPSNNLVEVWSRLCFNPRTLLDGLYGLVTVHWARLFGTSPAPAYVFGLESDAVQGLTGSGVVLGLAALLSIWRLVVHVRTSPGWWMRDRFAVYLLIVGSLSAGVFALGRCGAVSNVRYDLLSLLGATGLAGWFLATERRPLFRGMIIAVILAWSTLSATAHARIWNGYVFHRPPPSGKTSIVQNLKARGIRYAISDYWIAYYVTFVTAEQIIVAPDGFSRIAEYGQRVQDHRGEAIHISRTPCGDSKPLVEHVYFCGLE